MQKRSATGSTKHSSRVFGLFSPLAAQIFTICIEVLAIAAAIGAALMWGLSNKATQTVSYEFKEVDPSEYRSANGVLVYSYEEKENQMTLMLTEDLVNTVINRYLDDQGRMVNGYRIYEFVYRQNENKFHMLVQDGIFTVPAQAAASVSWDPDAREVFFRFEEMRLGETQNFWASNLNPPDIAGIRVPDTYFMSPAWLPVSGMQLSYNEMLLQMQPDLKAVSDMMFREFEADPVYLDWQCSMSDCPLIVRQLQTAVHQQKYSDTALKAILKTVTDEQENLPVVLACMKEPSVQAFLEKYTYILNPELVNLGAYTAKRGEILAKIRIAVGKDIYVSYQSLLENGIGITPDPLETATSSLDNSYVNFSDGQKLEGTAIVIQANTAEDPEVPETFCFTDKGTVYDYDRDAFITTELVTSENPVKTPHVTFLDDYRLYYDNATGTASVIISDDDGVTVISSGNLRRLTAAEADAEYPYRNGAPEMARIPAKDDADRIAMMDALEEALGEGDILSRYLSADSGSAFMVFSTHQHPERIRTCVLRKEGTVWIPADYDVMDYKGYAAQHPEINGTVFPLETTKNLRIRTIPQAGLQILLEKARQQNIVNTAQKIDFYYYVDNYIYVRFTNRRSCVFEVSNDEVILAFRSVESAAANWDLPNFFLLES